MVRGSGILLHLSSLPSAYGIGDMGAGAYDFADFLACSRQKYWQILPLNPTDPGSDHSPYHSYSAFAFNPLLISPDLLMEEGLLDQGDLEPLPDFPGKRVDYTRVLPFKTKIFALAFHRFNERRDNADFEKFCGQNAFWLDDFALFSAIKSRFSGKSWDQWPKDVRDRQTDSLEILKAELGGEIERAKFLQFLFVKQWSRLKYYCFQKGISVLGDIPIYVVHDSSDAWTHPELFKLDADKRPWVVAGVPPDYFSRTGQLWGNPLFRWDVLEKTGYRWWISRMKHNLKWFDLVRIDHFRGFVGYWEVPADQRTAVGGKWVEAPAMDFFNTLTKEVTRLPIVAEDLGTITSDVTEVMNHFGFPGMKVLQFAFGEDNPDHPYLPHTYPKNCLAYTGTHDNNTVKGWFENETTPEEKRRLFAYLGHEVSEQEISWQLIRLGAQSNADVFIVPLQDVLGLGEKARMNRPGTHRGNWRWRFMLRQLTPSVSKKLRDLTIAANRA